MAGRLRKNLVQAQALNDRFSLNDITNMAVGAEYTTVDQSLNSKEGSPCTNKQTARHGHSFDVAERQKVNAGMDSSAHRDILDVVPPNRIVTIKGKICLEVPESELDALKEVEAKRSRKPTVFIRKKDLFFFHRHSLQVYLRVDSTYNVILGSRTLPLEFTELSRISYDSELYDRHAVLILVEELFPLECKGIAANRVYFSELGVFALSYGHLPNPAGRTTCVIEIHPLPDMRPREPVATSTTEAPVR